MVRFCDISRPPSRWRIVLCLSERKCRDRYCPISRNLTENAPQEIGAGGRLGRLFRPVLMIGGFNVSDFVGSRLVR
jgi:hypothetical protein